VSSADGSEPEGSIPRQIVVTVEARYAGHLDEVCAGLTRSGVVIEQVMGELGMITGTAPDAEHLKAASTVEGVAAIDQTMPHHLPPPDSPVQ
jgi:hypothetical protein